MIKEREEYFSQIGTLKKIADRVGELEDQYIDMKKLKTQAENTLEEENRYIEEFKKGKMEHIEQLEKQLSFSESLKFNSDVTGAIDENKLLEMEESNNKLREDLKQKEISLTEKQVLFYSLKEE
eukprot:Trichotokara_eunicae@DN8708_c0_g1_i1.p1